MSDEPKKPIAAKPAEAKPANSAQPQTSAEAQIITPKAQFVKSDHKVVLGTDSAMQVRPQAQFKAGDHKIALRASKNKSPQKAEQPKPPKK